MASIIKYAKFINTQITRELRLPVDEAGQRLGQELATVDGFTYVFLPTGTTLPSDQPDEIDASIEPVTLSTALRDAICDASPLVRFIRQQVRAKIAEKYSISDEVKLLRTAPSDAFDAYNTYAEACRAWGVAEKAKLGL